MVDFINGAVGMQHDEQIIRFRTGSHGDYDNLLKQMKTV